MSAFDCNSRSTTTSVFDARETSPCEETTSEYTKTDNVSISIIQERSEAVGWALNCRVHLSRKVSRCGYNSITYGEQWVEFERSVEITPDECRKAHSSNRIMIDGMLHQIETGVPFSWTTFTHGSVDSDGACEVSDFWRQGKEYRKSYEQTMYSVYIAEVPMKIYRLENDIVIDGKLTAAYTDLQVRDVQWGLYVWSKNTSLCQQDYDILFTAVGLRYESKSVPSRTPIVIVEDIPSQRFAGFLLKEAISLCGQHIYKTQIPGVYVSLLRPLDHPDSSLFNQSPTINTRSEISAKISYLHLTTQLQLGETLQGVTLSLCQLSKNIIDTQLSMLSGTSAQKAASLIWGQGTHVTMASSAVYVTKCETVEVKRRDIANCSQEIPVYYGEVAMFMEPNTRILQVDGTLIPCDPTQPTMWELNGRWYCATPKIHRCEPPERVDPMSFDQLKWKVNTKGLDTSIYTEQQWEEHVRASRYDGARSALISNLTTVRMASENSLIGTSSVLTVKDLEDLTSYFGSALLPFFSWFGNVSSIFVAILFVAGILKSIMSGLLRMFMAYKLHGLSLKVLVALWGTLYQALFVPYLFVKRLLLDETLPLEAKDSEENKIPEEEDRLRQMEEGEELGYKLPGEGHGHLYPPVHRI